MNSLKTNPPPPRIFWGFPTTFYEALNGTVKKINNIPKKTSSHMAGNRNIKKSYGSWTGDGKNKNLKRPVVATYVSLFGKIWFQNTACAMKQDLILRIFSIRQKKLFKICDPMKKKSTAKRFPKG